MSDLPVTEHGHDRLAGAMAGIVSRLMPSLRSNLDELVRIPPISVPGRVDDSLTEANDMVAGLFADAGVEVGRLDLPHTDSAVNAVSPYARAVLNVRVPPAQDAAEAQAAVMAHLRELRPLRIELDVRPGPTGNGFSAVTTGPAYSSGARRVGARVGRGGDDGRQWRLDPHRERARLPCRTPRRCWSAPPTAFEHPRAQRARLVGRVCAHDCR